MYKYTIRIIRIFYVHACSNKVVILYVINRLLNTFDPFVIYVSLQPLNIIKVTTLLN